MTKQQLSDRANKAWATRRAQALVSAVLLSARAKKAWVTRRMDSGWVDKVVLPSVRRR